MPETSIRREERPPPAGETDLAPPPALRRLALLAVWIIIGVGIVLRLRRFVPARGLLHDEVLLTLNLKERSWIGLLSPLGHDQAAPVGYLWLSQLAATLGGYTEYSLRFVPLLASIGTLFLAWAAFRKRLAKPVFLGLLSVLATSEYLVSYAAEAKQYSTDALCALLLVCLAFSVIDRQFSRRSLMAFALAGAVIVWCSHPSVFILAGIGAYFLAVNLQRGTYQRSLAIVAMIGVWVVSFAVSYLMISRYYAHSGYLNAYWAVGFAPAPPRSLADLKWYWAAFVGMVDNPLALKFPYLVGVLLLLGAVNLWRASRCLFWLLLLPVGVTLLASMARKYPFDGRLLLFLVPSLLLILAHALAFQNASARAVAWSLFGLLLIYPVYLQSKYAVRVPVQYDVQPALAYTAEHFQRGDVVYLHWGADVVGSYYLDAVDARSVQPGPFAGADVIHGAPVTTEPEYRQDLRRLIGRRRVWVVFAMKKSVEQQKVLGCLDALGHRVVSYDDGNGASFLYSFAPAGARTQASVTPVGKS